MECIPCMTAVLHNQSSAHLFSASPGQLHCLLRSIKIEHLAFLRLLNGLIRVHGTMLSVGSYSVLSSFSKPCTDKVRTSSRHSQRKDPKLCSTCPLQLNAAIIIEWYVTASRCSCFLACSDGYKFQVDSLRTRSLLVVVNWPGLVVGRGR